MSPITERSGSVPKHALLLSLLCLWVPVGSSVLFPDWTTEDVGVLVWLLALVPGFLLSYYRGWKGASIALAGGMAAFSVAQAVVVATDASLPSPEILLGIVTVLTVVSLGSGLLSTLFHRSLDQAERLALTDTGTGIPNRRRAILELEKAFAAAERGSKLSVVLFDLDHFKRVNDRHGHAQGDRVLARFAEILQSGTRDMNVAARFGGEEFVAILRESSADGAEVYADRVRKRLKTLDLPSGAITVSAGVAEYEKGMASPDVLVAAADQALYRAKRSGRDRVVVLGRQGRRSAEDEGPSAEPGAGEVPRGDGELILVVDDDVDALRSVSRTLRRFGYTALESDSARRAVEIVRGLEHPIDLILTDVVMPDMGGFRLVEMLEEVQEGVRAIYMSGYSQEDVDWAGMPGAAYDYLSKPISIYTLASRVRRLLDQPVSSRTRSATVGGRSSIDIAEARTRSRITARTAELEEARDEVLRRLTWAAEFRDDVTGLHAERVGVLAGLIVRELGWSCSRRTLIEKAAPLHDLGKIAIPDSILKKPDALTSSERDVMESHTIVGAELLSGSRNPMIRLAEKIALTHHERWDGAGYPRGLAGEAIPEAGRVVAVADSFDSLTSRRPYREAIGVEDALAIIQEDAGSHFDPRVAEAFSRLVERGELNEALNLEIVARPEMGSGRTSPASRPPSLMDGTGRKVAPCRMATETS